MKFKNAFIALSTIATLFVLACSKDNTNVTPSTATVTGLTCTSATFSATATSGTSYTGNASVPYTGGSGVAFSAGSAIASTGVTGLTATLVAGTLASGSGTASFVITGTPTSSGTAAFAIALGGQSCTLSLPVVASTASVTSLNCTATPATATNGTVYTGATTLTYAGGNGGSYATSTAMSTGVLGLTATVVAGTLANGAGTLSYTISGTPTSAGTATFSISLGGQTCSVTITVGASSTGSSGTTANYSDIFAAVTAFKATLSASQLTTVQLSYTKANAIKWSNLPGGVSIRNGLEFSTLSDAQLTAALAIIKLAAGTAADEGFAEFQQIRYADTYLGLKANGYSEKLYIIAFIGTPSATGSWMLQFGGHHYAQNISFNNGAFVATTPSHQGVEPLSFTSNAVTYNPLKQEHAGMLAMLSSLSATELTSAKLSATFSDVALGPNKDGQFPATKLGLKVSALTTAQKALVLAAMKPWTDDANDTAGAAALKIYESELDNTYIAYSGNATLTNNADYVRIDGPSVWIELVCQAGVVYTAVHYHAVYRDHTKDYNGL